MDKGGNRGVICFRNSILQGATFMVALALFQCGCAGSKITQTVRGHYSGPQINAIALSPGGGVFADAIGVELFNYGFTVIDPDKTNEIIGRAGLSEFQILSPKGYETLKEAGIDALLVVKAIMSFDGTPESASIRITSTITQEVIAGLSWQNGWGGQRGSIADRSMRKNIADAAGEISLALNQRLRP